VKQQHTSTATSILTTKSTYRNLSAQRLSERTVLQQWKSAVFDVTFCIYVVYVRMYACVYVNCMYACMYVRINLLGEV
jgi:hypothetical protein